MAELTPRQIVRELDRYIIGQDEAKKSVAIALRNRYRRSQVDESMREEISPKNILMIGPTGVGKTEIARRLAKLVGAPFIKVEATKFTEVGYVGRDVESIVRDLMENAIRMVKEEHEKRVQTRAQVLAEDRLVTLLVHPPKKQSGNPLDYLLGKKQEQEPSQEEQQKLSGRREEIRQQLMRGGLQDRHREMGEEGPPPPPGGGVAISLPGIFLHLPPDLLGAVVLFPGGGVVGGQGHGHRGVSDVVSGAGGRRRKAGIGGLPGPLGFLELLLLFLLPCADGVLPLLLLRLAFLGLLLYQGFPALGRLGSRIVDAELEDLAAPHHLHHLLLRVDGLQEIACVIDGVPFPEDHLGGLGGLGGGLGLLPPGGEASPGQGAAVGAGGGLAPPQDGDGDGRLVRGGNLGDAH